MPLDEVERERLIAIGAEALLVDPGLAIDHAGRPPIARAFRIERFELPQRAFLESGLLGRDTLSPVEPVAGKLPFADDPGRVAGVPEDIAERDLAGRQISERLIIPVILDPGHQAGARGRAQGHGVRIVEAQPLLRHAIEIGSEIFAAIGIDGLDAHVVGENEDDIGTRIGAGRSRNYPRRCRAVALLRKCQGHGERTRDRRGRAQCCSDPECPPPSAHGSSSSHRVKPASPSPPGAPGALAGWAGK